MISFKGFKAITDTYKDLPPLVRKILLPKTHEEWSAFEESLLKLRKREETRDAGMKCQRAYELPLRPNQPLRRTLILLHIKTIKEDMRRTKWDDKDQE